MWEHRGEAGQKGGGLWELKGEAGRKGGKGGGWRRMCSAYLSLRPRQLPEGSTMRGLGSPSGHYIMRHCRKL